jgi:energy-coupling factor transport system ATP-binding protein
MNLLELKGVEYNYNENDEPALKDINLSIRSGEFVVIIGSNGSGKSTLAKLLNVLLLPSKGDIYIDGINTTENENKWLIRQKVGMVFQNPDNQIVATMVEDDVAFGPENLGIPSNEIQRRVDNSLKMVGMEGFNRFEPHKLSGGQKQRVAIAGIIAMEPSCIVLDEPTAMLDPKGRDEVMNTIKFLNKEKGITVIHITHFMEEAVYADRVFVMYDGKIEKEGTPLDIFKDIKKLKDIYLDVPVVVELAQDLRKAGLSIPDVITVDGLVKVLC